MEIKTHIANSVHETILITSEENIRLVQFNKPRSKNALDSKMYIQLTRILEEAAADDKISVVVLTGTGDFYCSGNDLVASLESVSIKTNNLLPILTNFINAFITFPKLLIAIVNGPAIGIAATTLPLCDMVFASENAYFYTPFTKLGLVPEGSSTYTFPKLMGMRKATEMLMFNHRMTAAEALQYGFINYIYKPEELKSKVWTKIKEMSKLPQFSIIESKKLLRRKQQKEMIDANKNEIKALNLAWTSEDLVNNILSFMNQKSKI